MCNQSPRFEPWSSTDPAVRARERGRSITKALARALLPTEVGHLPRLNPEMQGRIAAGDEQAWAFHILPSGGYTEPLKRQELTFDEAEARGLDGTGRDLDPAFPHRGVPLSPLEERAMDGDR